MTEQEWMDCTDPQYLEEYLAHHESERKLRLFAAVCCRRIWPLLLDDRTRYAVEASEAFANGMISRQELRQAGKEGRHAWREASRRARATGDPLRRAEAYRESSAAVVGVGALRVGKKVQRIG